MSHERAVKDVRDILAWDENVSSSLESAVGSLSETAQEGASG